MLGNDFRGHGRAWLLALALVGCGSTTEDAASDPAAPGGGGFGSTTDPAGAGGSSGGDPSVPGGGGTGAATSGTGDGGGDAGASSGGTGSATGTGGSMYAGPLENVGDGCTGNDACVNGMCATDITAYGTQPGGACTRTCSTDDECGGDGVCANLGLGRQCLLTCTQDGDCRDEYFCSTRNDDLVGNGPKVCRPKPSGRVALEAGEAGSGCTAPSDCATGGTCLTQLERRTPAPDGYCSGGCFEDTDCGTGGICIGELRSGPGVLGQCYEKCADASTCPSEYECRTPFTADGSLIGLVSERACMPPAPPTTLTGNTTGKKCANDDGCPGGVCESEVAGRSTNDGICTGTCTNNNQCGTGADCYGANALAGTQGECLRKCTGIANCDDKQNHVCATVGALDSQKYCLPRQPWEPVQM